MSEQIEYPASAVESYERNNVKLLFRPWAEVVVERSGVSRGDRVLDVACGTGILVRTGKFRPEALHSAAGVPDVVIESIADLPDFLGLR